MKLVENWRKSWRMVSVQCMVVATAIQGAWLYLPEDMQATIPDVWVRGITITLLVLGTLGRLVKQEKVSGDA